MSVSKSKTGCRVRTVLTLDPDAIKYVETKAELFKQGRRGGFSEAVNRMIFFCRDYEIEQQGGQKE